MLVSSTGLCRGDGVLYTDHYRRREQEGHDVEAPAHVRCAERGRSEVAYDRLTVVDRDGVECQRSVRDAGIVEKGDFIPHGSQRRGCELIRLKCRSSPGRCEQCHFFAAEADGEDFRCRNAAALRRKDCECLVFDCLKPVGCVCLSDVAVPQGSPCPRDPLRTDRILTVRLDLDSGPVIERAGEPAHAPGPVGR